MTWVKLVDNPACSGAHNSLYECLLQLNPQNPINVVLGHSEWKLAVVVHGSCCQPTEIPRSHWFAVTARQATQSHCRTKTALAVCAFSSAPSAPQT